MTERCYLHVGAPKSGTTYLQDVLATNRERLAASGALVVGRSQVDRVHAGMVLREDPRLADLRDHARGAWARLVAEIREWPGPISVLSYELFAGAEPAQIARAIDDLAGIEVHVVITARDLAKAVPSSWQERLKFGLTTPLENWIPPPESAGVRSEWGWRTMDPAGVARRWGANLRPEHVHIVTTPRVISPAELWQRFAATCSLPTDGVELNVDRVNESLGLVEAELLRRINERMRPPITGSREYAVWVRDTLAHLVLARLGKEPIGVTDQQLADAQQRATEAVAAIADAGYDVCGDLDDLAATSATARTPAEVADSELLASAVEAIVGLLLVLRDQVRRKPIVDPGSRPSSEQPGVKRAIGNVARWAAGPYVNRRTEQLLRQVEALEAEVAQARGLQLRVATLQDVVAELLLPASAADTRVTASALRAYRKGAL
ncbi:MAG: DUF6752 domain-containing protein [Nocardioides sp.]